MPLCGTHRLLQYMIILKVYNVLFRGDYKHWTQDPRTQDPRTEDPRTRGPGTRGPGTQRSSSVVLSFYDRNATCVNVLSSNVRLYGCGPQSLPCYTHSRRSSHQIVLFTLSTSFLYLFFTLQNPRIVSFIACKATNVTSYRYSH